MTGATLAERIARGRAAIASARAAGKDTTAWEQHLAALEAATRQPMPLCQTCGLRPSPRPPHGRCRECITAAWHPVSVPLTCAACGGRRWHLWQHADTSAFEWMCAACRPLVQIVSDGREVR